MDERSLSDIVRCAHCSCPRLDAMEQQVAKLLDYYGSYHRMEQAALLDARKQAASNGGELVTRREIQRNVGVTRGCVQTWVADPTFPSPVNIPTGRTAERYSKAAVDEWLAEHRKKPKVMAHALRKQNGAG